MVSSLLVWPIVCAVIIKSDIIQQIVDWSSWGKPYAHKGYQGAVYHSNHIEHAEKGLDDRTRFW